MKQVKKAIDTFRNRKGALDRPLVTIDSNYANDLLTEALQSNEPKMIARFGAFEISIAHAVFTPINFRNVFRLLSGEIASIGLSQRLVDSFCNNAGFFPKDIHLIKKYAELLVSDMADCDILGSWCAPEKYFAGQLKNCTKIARIDLEPFHHEKPWTSVLAGKKVLVIHPYQDSIMNQWPKRRLLFKDKNILPDFDLQILKAVQSAGGVEAGYATWFDALDSMKAEIDRRDFDIALIGCGAYGFHLAAHIKRNGKKAFHLGGVLQILFGILGKRWDGMFDFVNEHWIRPLPSDTITNANTIEGGCYW